MDQLHTTTFTPDRERGQHLTFEDRCSIKLCKKLGFSLRKIAGIIDCAASAVSNELRRGTGVRNGKRGRFPEYSAKRGQKNYEINRSRCHKAHKLESSTPFVEWVVKRVREEKWSLDVCVGYARRHKLFPAEQILQFADKMNALPRKLLGYRTPEELFDAFLDQVYSVDKVQVA